MEVDQPSPTEAQPQGAPWLSTATSPRGRFAYYTSDFAFHQELAAGRAWDDDLLSLLLPLVSTRRNIVDVGAHIGTHSVAYQRHTSGTVYCYEAQSAMFELLRQNLAANGCGNAVCRHAAVGHREGQATLSATLTDGPVPGVQADPTRPDQQNLGGMQLGTGGETVRMVRLDDEEVGDVGLLKLDVEGAEPLALYGARELIARCRPLILFEQNHKRITSAMLGGLTLDPEHACFDFISFCAAHGYSGPVALAQDNFVLVPRPREGQQLEGLWRDESDCPYLVTYGEGDELLAFSPAGVPQLLMAVVVDGTVRIIGRFDCLLVGELRDAGQLIWSNGESWRQVDSEYIPTRAIAALVRIGHQDISAGRVARGWATLPIAAARRLPLTSSRELIWPDVDSDSVLCNPTVFHRLGGSVGFAVRIMNYRLLDRRDCKRGTSANGTIHSRLGMGSLPSGLVSTVHDLDLAGRAAATIAPAGRCAFAGLEDARLVALPGGGHLALGTIVNGRTGVQELCLVPMDAALTPGQVRQLSGGPIRPNIDEKNWMPFVHDDCLYAVYCTNPLRIVAVDALTGACTLVCDQVPRLSFPCTFRGGSPGIPWDGGYLFVVHEVFDTPNLTPYLHRFVLIQADPWLVRGVSQPFYFQAHQVEFCAGLLADGDDLLLSYGVGDCRGYVGRIARGVVNNMIERFSVDKPRPAAAMMTVADDQRSPPLRVLPHAPQLRQSIAVERDCRPTAYTVALASPIGTHDSISYVGHSLLRALTDLGHQPGLFPAIGTPFDSLQPVHHRALARARNLRLRSPHRVDRLLVWNGYTKAPPILACSREAIVYWDSDTLSDQAIRTLRGYDRVWGVSTFVVNTLARAGIGADVLAHGVWPDEAPPWTPPVDGPVTFLHMGQVCHRKGTDILLQSFRAAFPPECTDVRLLIKCWPAHADLARRWIADLGGGDARIVLDARSVPRSELATYFQRTHAVVMPSRCEAFGLVGLEALAHGRALIATDYGGPADYLADDCIRIPARKAVPAEGHVGFAAECSIDDLVCALRAVAHDPAAASAAAEAARARVVTEWTWTASLRRAGLAGGRRTSGTGNHGCAPCVNNYSEA